MASDPTGTVAAVIRILKEANLIGDSPTRAISVDEFAKRQGICPRNARKLVAEGKIKTGRIGRRIVIYPQDLEAFEQAARTGGI